MAEALVRFPSAGDPIQGYLTKPKGAGPFPAVVLLHSCLGLPAGRRSMADTFAGWGYVALFVDDFTTRGVRKPAPSISTRPCPTPMGPRLSIGASIRRPGQDRRDRFFAGRRHRAQDRFVPPLRRLGRRERSAFKAAAAFYPPCDNVANCEFEIPTLILVGAMDDVTPAADCARLAGRQPGSIVKLVVYPRARHGFDNPEFGEARGSSGCGWRTIATLPSGRGRNCAIFWRRGSPDDAGVGVSGPGSGAELDARQATWPTIRVRYRPGAKSLARDLREPVMLRREFLFGLAASVASVSPAYAGAPKPFEPDMWPPMGNRSEFVAWMAANRGEEPTYSAGATTAIRCSSASTISGPPPTSALS